MHKDSPGTSRQRVRDILSMLFPPEGLEKRRQISSAQAQGHAGVPGSTRMASRTAANSAIVIFFTDTWFDITLQTKWLNRVNPDDIANQSRAVFSR